MSTYRELYLFGKNRLKEPHEALIFCEEILGADRKKIALRGEESPHETDEKRYLDALAERAKGTPLQYILGYEYFRGMKLTVRSGVLIPREDTEALVNEAARYIGGQNMRGVDLCAGTGAVALGIARGCRNVSIAAAELYEEPFRCLEENSRRYGEGRVCPLKLDVTEPAAESGLDFVVSNPPYIAAEEIPSLQAEVRLEPRTALNGGADGLDFYKSIASNWGAALRKGGLMAFEIGDAQAAAVCRIMEKNGFGSVKTIKDINGLDRVVSGIKI